MTPELRGAIERAVEAATGRPVAIAGAAAVGGGSIHRAELLDLADGGRLFVKSSRDPRAGEMFRSEAAGLAALAAAGAIRVPGTPLPGRAGETAYLVMEAIATGPRPAGFFADFGRRFAGLHRATARHGAEARFGFPHDNFVGATAQPNGWRERWVDFFRERRLGHQIALARERGLADAELDRLAEGLLERLDEWLYDGLDLRDEPSCLLHGDLWSGNFLCDSQGRPAIVDPAAYYGHREADLAMTELFGGFDRSFYAAYEDAWPLPPGSAQRREIYKLYHLLNHLNLFGGGYRGQCVAVLRRLL